MSECKTMNPLPERPAANELHSAKGRPHYGSHKREEYAHVTFDLDADLSSLFNWNTKQIYLYVVASYPSTSPSTIPPSEAVVWDAIIPSDYAPFHVNTYIHPAPKTAKPKDKLKAKRAAKPYPAGTEPGIVKLKDQKPKYQITDATGKIAARENATLTLHWNVQPFVGFLTWTNTNTYGRWEGLKGGKTEPFAFPALKESEKIKKEDLKTEKGAEAYRLHVG